MSDSDNENDKTSELTERLEDDDTVGGNSDSDSGVVYTLDDGAGDDETETEANEE